MADRIIADGGQDYRARLIGAERERGAICGKNAP